MTTIAVHHTRLMMRSCAFQKASCTLMTRRISSYMSSQPTLTTMNPAVMLMAQPIAPPMQDSIVWKPFAPLTNIEIPQISDPFIDCPCSDSVNEPLHAVKRTYQPSVLRRKRKHGFFSRRLTVSGRKLLKRRFLKGRQRMSA